MRKWCVFLLVWGERGPAGSRPGLQEVLMYCIIMMILLILCLDSLAWCMRGQCETWDAVPRTVIVVTC